MLSGCFRLGAGLRGSRMRIRARSNGGIQSPDRIMRDHQRRTEIRLIVLREEARKIEDGLQREDSLTAGSARDDNRALIAHHVDRFLYFSDLPEEFRKCNPAVPWGKLRSLRRPYHSRAGVPLEWPRSFEKALQFARDEIPKISRHLAAPNFPSRWRNEPVGDQGIDQVLGPYRSQILLSARRHGVRRIRVYGSVARGEADRRSDVDLLVEWGRRAKPLATYSFKDELERIIRRKVDLHDAEHTYWAVRDRVLSEAVPFL